MYYSTARAAAPDLHTRWKDGVAQATDAVDAIAGALSSDPLGFGDLFRWFRDREDYENAEKVRRASLAWSDPQLDAVRAAIAALLPGFSGLRVDRGVLRMVVEKEGVLLYLHQLSDGERTLLAVGADIARRLAIANPDAQSPLACEAVVLLDEVELHLHPAWQRTVLPSLRRAFPRGQFIVTTHSPQVLGEVPNDAVVLLKDFGGYAPPAPTAGRDANAILREVLGVTTRPAAVAQELDAIRDLLDEGRYAEARGRLDVAAAALTERDPDVRTMRAVMDVVEGLDGSAPEPTP
jgi:5'-deoxynucleotidase YfbR-like HD superfamily hydrolase